MMKHFRNAPWITDTDEMVSQWTFWMVIDTTGPTAINEIEYRHDAKFVRCAARRHPDTAGRNHFTCDFTWRDMVPRETIPYQMLGTDRLERDKCDYMRFWEDYHDCDGNVELLNCVNRYELFCIKPVKKEKDTDAAAGPS
jgi:hypothetical protein